MELKYGTHRAFEISVAFAIALCAGTYIFTNSNIGIAFGMLVLTLLTFRGVIRYFLCSKWIKVEASVLGTEDQSGISLSWRGSASMSFNYRLNIEYSVEGSLYRTDIFLEKPEKESIFVYYKPGNPEIVCSNVGLGWDGIIFMSAFLTIVLNGIFPNFIAFDALKYLGDLLSSLKEKL